MDNVDFSEDTPDEKRTLHGTVMAIYQQYKEGDVTKRLKFTEATLTSSLTQIPRTVTELLPCHVAGNVKPKILSHKTFKLEEKYRLSGYETDDLVWLFAKTLHFKNEVEKPNQCGIQDKTLVEGGGETAELIDKAAILGNDYHLLCELQQNTEEEVLVYATRSKNVPTRSSYNSVLNHSLPLAKVSMPPLIAAPSHEFSTLLTIFRQAERIKTLVVGVNQKTVITLDMGLYKPAKQLEYALECCQGKWILQPGELHTVMAQLRTIGSSIESSGLDDFRTESAIYGPATVKQILEGKNMKRGIEAHVTTLFSLYAEEFFIQHPKQKEDLQSHVKAIDEA